MDKKFAFGLAIFWFIIYFIIFFQKEDNDVVNRALIWAWGFTILGYIGTIKHND